MDTFGALIESINFADIRNVLIVMGVFVGVFLSLFVFFTLSPVANISTSSGRISEDYTAIEVTIENISKVRMRLKLSGEEQEFGIHLQSFSHTPVTLDKVPNFLPFSKNKHSEVFYPVEWRAPLHIMTSTKWIYPNEVIKAEFLIKHPKGNIVHFGVQVHAKYGWLETIRFRKPALRWTSVKFLSDKGTKPS